MAKKNDTYWVSDGSYWPEISPLTKAKHHLIEEYIEHWVFTLCGNNIGKKRKLVIVDGFCGGGIYKDPETQEMWTGSPIRIINAVNKGLQRVQIEKSKINYQLDIKYIFIDEKQAHLDSLKIHMRGQGLEKYLEKTEVCEFICGEFEEKIDSILTEVKKSKCSSFFFLDPFGYSQVSMTSMRKIINLGKSEILYTFMIEFVRRFLKESDKSLEHTFKYVLEAQGYYEIDEKYEDTAAEQEWLRDQTLNLFRRRTNADFVYGFSLLHNTSMVKYYLIHLASSVTAQRVMKTSMWNQNNLDYLCSHHDKIYGMGFKSKYYYQEQNLPSLLDITSDNVRACLDRLDNAIMPIIYANEDGITFGKLEQNTIQINPATIKHYVQYVDEQRNAQEIEVIRDGKVTKSKSLKSTDILIRPRHKQLNLFVR